MAISPGNKILASDVVAHINNKNNPHGITPAQIGAAASSHTHDNLYATREWVESLIAMNKSEFYSLNVSFTETRGGQWDEKARYTAKKSYTVAKITLTSAIEYYARGEGYSVDTAVNQGVVWTLSPGNYIQIPTSMRDPRQRFYFDGTNFIVQATNTFSHSGRYSEGFRETLYLEFQ